MQVVLPNAKHLEMIAQKHGVEYTFVEMLCLHAQSNANFEAYFRSHQVSDALREDVLFASKELTVGQLIDLLSKFPKDMLVVGQGCEGGFDSVVGATTIKVTYDVHLEWYYGKHEQEKDSEQEVLLIQTTRGWRH